MIPRHKIDEILDAAHIEDVVGSYITLKKRGSSLQGLCPFHNEKTPSFNVSPSKGIYKCFGCGKAGNSLNFVMDYEHLDFMGALKLLADRYNIELPKQEISLEEITEEKRKQQEKESLQVLNNYALEYFEKILQEDEEGRLIGLSYFEERGFRPEIISKFKLGFAKEAWDHFYQEAIKNGFSEEMLLKSGLVKKSDQGKLYDAYRSRVIFSIHGLNGKPIAFAGRILKAKDEKSPKYVNSPETDLYHKSNELYGLFFARQTISKQDFVYLVEGYTDVISLHQAGIENVVASSGTSLTENQIKLIKRFTQNVTVLYDGDAAGIKASLRGIDMLLEAGLNVRIVLFPDGEDPDSYCKKLGPLPFAAFLDEHKQDFILFKAGLLQAEAGNDPIKKAELLRDIMLSIGKIPDAFKRANFTRECSKILKTDEQLLVNELNRVLRNKLSAEARTEIKPAEDTPNSYEEEIRQLIETQSQDYPEKELLRILLRFGDKPYNEAFHVASFILHEINIQEIEIENPVVKDIFQFVATCLHDEKEYIKALTNSEDPKMSRLIADLLSEKYILSKEGWKRFDVEIEDDELTYKHQTESALLMLYIRHNEMLIQQNQKDFNSVSEEELINMMSVHKLLLEERTKLTSKLGTVIIK
jgi:DNA primase